MKTFVDIEATDLLTFAPGSSKPIGGDHHFLCNADGGTMHMWASAAELRQLANLFISFADQLDPQEDVAIEPTAPLADIEHDLVEREDYWASLNAAERVRAEVHHPNCGESTTLYCGACEAAEHRAVVA